MPASLWFVRSSGWLTRPPSRRLATLGVFLLSSIGVLVYALSVNEHYALSGWLFWRLCKIWGYTALANLAWFSAGSLVVGRLLGLRELPLLESSVLRTAVGVVVFTELMYLGGALRLFGPVFAILLAALLILSGLPEVVRVWRQFRAESLERQPAGPLLLLLWGAGITLTTILYLGLLSPDAINYDASWCHLTVAQDYAREGRIVPFPADYSKNVPQLAALLRTWDFSVPALRRPALRWMLCLHEEFGLFLWTLAGVAAATRFMARNPKLRGSWVAFYLFPIIFVYDHNLGGAADHVAAFFALPGLVAAGRLLERLTWQRAVPMVICMAGGFLTKYQAFYWIVPLLVVVGVRWAGAAWKLRGRGDPALRERRTTFWLLPGIGAGFALLVLPHFLRNWLFYHNPLFPFAQQLFATQPTVDNASYLFNNLFIDLNWVPKGTLLERLRHALKLAFTFSFEPHYSFTKNFPVFGSLFTLLLPALFFVRERRYKWLGAFVGLTTLLLWGFTFNVDRNLQIFLPILVATTAAILAGIAELGGVAQLAVAPLVLFQIVWGADAIFYSSRTRIQSSLALISSGFDGSAATRFDEYRASFLAVNRALPERAKVLLHMSHVNLGVDRELVLDWAGFQGQISYSKVHTIRELAELYQKLGITHLLYTPGERTDSTMQGEIAFQSFVAWLGSPRLQQGGLTLYELPAELPPAEAPYKVLSLGVSGYGTGVFPIERMHRMEYLSAGEITYPQAEQAAPGDAAALAALGADAVLVGSSRPLNAVQRDFLAKNFTLAVRYSGWHSVYVRRRGPATKKH